jgi:hypothetical protein
MLASGCSSISTNSADWTPRPLDVAQLRVLATSDADGFRLRTQGGDRGFLTGVNLGPTLPLHHPRAGHATDRAHFRRWIAEMGDLGIRSVRVYDLLPAGFYAELLEHNRRHPSDPIYLVQGVYLPDESHVDAARTLYDENVDRAFARAITDTSAAVHGDRAGYDADVSPWLAAWIIGMEWDPEAVQRTDETNREAPASSGHYFRATADATPTERWLAKHLDTLAAAEAKRGTSVPIAFVNWSTTDPLRHPAEPLENEDLVAIDARNIRPTTRWPGGTFASFHAYPYFPDFLRHEPGHFAGYLGRLRDHFAGTMPVLITEFGVPSSLGSAHDGPDGVDNGGHSEREAMRIDADLMRTMSELGLGGAFVFSWIDEWFKPTWNTARHQVDQRRQFWHDPLTTEQWFGLIATDPQPLPDASTDQTFADGPVKYVHVRADASWVHIDVSFRNQTPVDFVLEADVIPGADSADYRVVVSGSQARAQVRAALDPIRLDTTERPYRPDAAEPWHTYALLTNRANHRSGHEAPAEFDVVGNLQHGSTWTRRDNTVSFKLPWSMLGLADPSSRTALGEGEPAELVQIPGITFTLAVGGERVAHAFTWEPWNFTEYRERRKDGLAVLTDAMRELAR